MGLFHCEESVGGWIVPLRLVLNICLEVLRHSAKGRLVGSVFEWSSLIAQKGQAGKCRDSGPHLAKFYGACLAEDPVSLVMEYMPGGDLERYLRRARSWLRSRRSRQVGLTLVQCTTDLIQYSVQRHTKYSTQGFSLDQSLVIFSALGQEQAL